MTMLMCVPTQGGRGGGHVWVFMCGYIASCCGSVLALVFLQGLCQPVVACAFGISVCMSMCVLALVLVC